MEGVRNKMIKLNNTMIDAKHLGFTPYQMGQATFDEVATTLFSETDYIILSGYIWLRNPQAELMMTLKYGDLIARIDYV